MYQLKRPHPHFIYRNEEAFIRIFTFLIHFLEKVNRQHTYYKKSKKASIIKNIMMATYPYFEARKSIFSHIYLLTIRYLFEYLLNRSESNQFPNRFFKLVTSFHASCHLFNRIESFGFPSDFLKKCKHYPKIIKFVSI